jgi:polyferredoxin
VKTKLILKNRKIIQALAALVLLASYQYFQLDLLTIFIAGSVLGILFGKVFCRWVCPIGFFMEILFRGDSGTRARQMYQYHKVGCPIAWVSGFLNKYSLFKIKRDAASCTSCGLCDKSCYIAALNTDLSLYRKNKEFPGYSFNCSKCMECVTACPQGSLTFGL